MRRLARHVYLQGSTQNHAEHAKTIISTASYQTATSNCDQLQHCSFAPEKCFISIIYDRKLYSIVRLSFPEKREPGFRESLCSSNFRTPRRGCAFSPFNNPKSPHQLSSTFYKIQT